MRRLTWRRLRRRLAAKQVVVLDVDGAVAFRKLALLDVLSQQVVK